MKKSLLVASSMAFAIGAFAQGTVNFNNLIASTLDARVFNVDPGNPGLEVHGQTATGIPAGGTVYGGTGLLGTGFTAQLWGHVGSGVAEGSLDLLATTTFRTSAAAAGLINTAGLPGGVSLIAVPGAVIDGSDQKGTFQLRAWNNANGTISTWAQALATPGVAFGTSLVFSPGGNLGGTGSPPSTATFLTGLQSFSLHIVPEPSLIALGALGVGALLLRRRKA